MTPAEKLWLPPSARENEMYRKAAPPKLGPSYGAWGGDFNVLRYMDLPGGSVLQFDLSKLTLGDYRQMRFHYQINATLSVLTFTIHQLDWWIDCDDKRIANFVEDNLREVWTRLIRSVVQAYWAGFSPMALEFENDALAGKIKINKFKDLVPEQCHVNWKEVLGPPSYGPGGAGVRQKRYIYDGIKQMGENGHIPVHHTLWYPVLMENGDMRGRKLLKPVFAPYFFSQLIHLFTNRYFERFGEPLIVGRAPFDQDVIDAEGNTKSARDATIDMIKDLRNRSAVVLPNDRTMNGNGDQNDFEYLIDFLETQLRGVDFDRYIMRLDEEMSIGMFVPVLLFRTADVGSYNLGQAHERTFYFMINALAGDLAEYLDRYVLNKLVDYNYSPNAPRVRFRYRQLGKDRDETLRAIIQAGLQQQMFRPDLEELGMAVGMEFEDVKRVMDPLTGTVVPKVPMGPDRPLARQVSSNENGNSSNENTNLTIRQAADRLFAQLSKAEREDFEPKVEIGYKRKMWDAMIEDGELANKAEDRIRDAYSLAERWLSESLISTEIGAEERADTVAKILSSKLA